MIFVVVKLFRTDHWFLSCRFLLKRVGVVAAAHIVVQPAQLQLHQNHAAVAVAVDDSLGRPVVPLE